MAIDINALPEDSGAPRQPYNGPTQQDTSAPTPPNIQPDQQGQMVSPIRSAQPQPAAPSVTTPPVAPSPNQRLHSFVSATLSSLVGAMAGKGPTNYTADPTTGKIVGTPVQESNLDKLRRVGANALTGLGAGAQAGGQKSGLANALAGLGAGASAQTASAQAADKQAKQQANEDFGRQQQKIMSQYQIAHTNAMTYTTYSHDMREEDEHDPQRKKYNQWADAAEQGGLDVRTMSAQEAKAAQASDPSFATNHLILPGGFKPQSGPNGEVLMDPNTQQPLRDGQVLVIQGGHMDASGNKMVSLPASLVNDVHKYGDLLGIGNAKGLKEGDEVDAEQFFKLIGVAQEGNKKQQEGWLKPIISQDRATGKTFEKNSNTGEVREATAIPTVDVKNLSDADKKDNSGQVTPALIYTQQQENLRAAMKKASDQKAGQNTDVFGNVSTLAEKEFNKRYDSFNKSKQYQTLGVLQGSYDQFQQAVRDIDSGKPLSGAQSVVQLFNAIGISATPLAGKGFRINENTVKEHVEARGLDQSALQKLEKLETGAVITEKQLKDYAGIAAQVYKNSFINAAKEQKRQLGYIDVLPLGNNEPVDAMTASLYLQTAGGDRAKAESALKKSGWLIPQR